MNNSAVQQRGRREKAEVVCLYDESTICCKTEYKQTRQTIIIHDENYQTEDHMNREKEKLQ